MNTQMINICLDKGIYCLHAVKNRILIHDIVKKNKVLVQSMRKKKRIKVLFVISNLSKWKTECLYKAMISHPRFEPIIGVALGVVDYPSYEAKCLKSLVNYLEAHKYSYTEIRTTSDIQERICPDIVFYQQADGGIYDCLNYTHLHDMLFCYISYGVSTGTDKYAYNNLFHNICWLWFVENELVIEYASSIMTNHAYNLVATGTPMMDELLIDKTQMDDPWKQQSCEKKRIIWAPHHTIGIGKEEIHYGTFLEVADGMVELAQKYQNEIQWSFKPHPSLKQKLYYLWGEKRTDEYYGFWENTEYSQFESGKYIGLFKYSDAMIHDCGSFTTEYLYMCKPCMYLVNNKKHPLNEFGQACYDQYYKGYSIKDIEHFIQCIINGIDPMKEKRDAFFRDYLLPPNGKSACEGIINFILGI